MIPVTLQRYVGSDNEIKCCFYEIITIEIHILLSYYKEPINYTHSVSQVCVP